MANEILTIPLRTFVNKRAIPAAVIDYVAVPATGTGSFWVRTVELPEDGGAITVTQVDPISHVFIKSFAVVASGTPTTNQVLVDARTYNTGEFGFIYSGNLGITIKIAYSGTGSSWFAEDVNEIQSGTLLKLPSTFALTMGTLVATSATISGDLTVGGAFVLSGSSTFCLPKVATDVSAIYANIGVVYYHTVEKQFKGIVEAETPGTAKIVIMG